MKRAGPGWQRQFAPGITIPGADSGRCRQPANSSGAPVAPLSPPGALAKSCASVTRTAPRFSIWRSASPIGCKKRSSRWTNGCVSCGPGKRIPGTSGDRHHRRSYGGAATAGCRGGAAPFTGDPRPWHPRSGGGADARLCMARARTGRRPPGLGDAIYLCAPIFPGDAAEGSAVQL